MNRTDAGTLMTEIILEVFKLSGLLVLEGDQLTKELGLTSARWKVLGALAGAGRPMTVPDIARSMGQTRQAVQRLVNEMKEDGLLDTQTNPGHKRAKYQILTGKGKEYFDIMERKQIPWVNAVADGFDVKDLKNVSVILRKLTETLEP
ncbi:MAG: MarR family transcriptional regulator [Candidatus Thiodiazotropha sp. (ex Codakia rugifera)]|nr:MarR family transcriptional regulator [Candidatus Thiodiazotropha sp. (ex Codakia rugifera)]